MPLFEFLIAGMNFNKMNRKSGTYALLFSSLERKNVCVGKLGVMKLRQGFYVYVGSAFGPGGLAARVGRHQKISKPARWHIDYLRPHLCWQEAWVINDEEKWEHRWAEVLREWRSSEVPLAGFGSSDCQCQAHLFYFSRRPTISTFRKRLGATGPDRSAVAVKRFL